MGSPPFPMEEHVEVLDESIVEGNQKTVKNKCELSNHNQGNKISRKILTVVKKAKEID